MGGQRHYPPYTNRMTLSSGADAVLAISAPGPGQELSLDTQTANTVFAGPSAAGPSVPTFRTLVTADLPAGVGTVTAVTGTSPIASSGGATPDISLNANGVTFAKMQTIATDSLLGRDTAGTGNVENILLNATLSMDGAGNLQRAALTGNVTASAGSNTTTIAAGVVTEAMQVLADNTTQDVSTTKHGYVPKAPNSTVKWLAGDGSWTIAPGRYLTKTVYAASASANHTTGANTALIHVRMVGGGGGGGGANSAAANAGGAGGGGSGGYLEAWIAVSASSNYAYVVGAKGTGGAAGNNDGNNGTDSTLVVDATTYTAQNGVGGTGMASGSGVAFSAGGTGGTVSTNGDVNTTGTPGQAGRRASATNVQSGTGGSSVFGGGGTAGNLSGGGAVTGGNAGGAGSGGGGGCGSGGSGPAAGGDGADGIIIIEEYS